MSYGYCVCPRPFSSELHPESGPIWKWGEKNMDNYFARLGANLDGNGTGALRRIPKEDRDDLKKIFDVTGATAQIENINKYAIAKAKEMGLTPNEYFMKVFKETDKDHLNR